jgi:hypothetical protein
MESGGLNQTHHAALAREAEPIRRWLTGYFTRRVRNRDDIGATPRRPF